METWLCEEGLQELVSIFKANNMDGPELSRLNKETATELGIGEDAIHTPVTNITALRTLMPPGGGHEDSGLLGIYCSIPKHDKLASNSMI